MTIGGAALGGLALNQILQREASAGIINSHKAIINIYLPGGPPHIDMWDLKPDAPIEIRGDFKPISSNVPGIQICELFPQIASMMDKFAIIRTLCDSDGLHDGYQCMTGHKRSDRGPSNGWPSAGAWVSRLGGKVDPAVPANMAVMYQTGNATWGQPSGASFLGAKHNPFNVVGRKAREKSDNMVLQGIASSDSATAICCASRWIASAAIAIHRARWTAATIICAATGILTSSKLGDALDLSKEDPGIVTALWKE